MTTARAAVLCGFLTACICWPAPARASGPADQAAAETLFNEARVLVAAGNYAQACSKFVESQRLDPTAGTLLSIGDCYEKLGKLASAWGAFKEAEMVSSNAGDTGRRGEAARRAEALAPRLAKLIITLSGGPVGGLKVVRDGALVGEGQLGTAVPVDPGEHVIEASAPGRKSWTTRFTISTPGTVMATVPSLAEDSAAKHDLTPDQSTALYWTPRRVSGVVMASLGFGGLVAGAALGGLALSKNRESKANCSPGDPNFCNNLGAAVRNDAVAFGNGSTAGIVVGGVLLTGGLVIFATAPKPETARIELLPGIGALTLRGTF
jgi:hypothetical protein